MKCPNCRAKMTCESGKHHYMESGLDNVYLLGVEICRCRCGEEVVSIPEVVELQSKIALALVKKRSLLTAKEIRFLRKNIGLTATKLAGMMGVDNATISRWENDKQVVDKSKDRLLRLVFLNFKGISPEEIRHLMEDDFMSISPRYKKTKPYMIPVNEWAKTNLCFSP